MKTPINVLLVEDVRTDAELAIRELTRAGLATKHRIVETEEGFREALAKLAPDVILSDFSMPRFDGMRALSMARDLCPDVPFIFVSGTIGEENAIRALKNGATDYVLKSNLIRLPAAVERALQDARERAAHRQTQRESEAKYRNLIDAMSEGLGVQDGKGLITFMNKRACEMLGYELEEMVGNPITFLFDEENRQVLREQMASRRKGKQESFEIAWLRKDGGKIDTIITPRPRFDESGELVESVAVFTDITQRKRMERAVRDAELKYRAIFEHAVEGIFLVDAEGRVLSSNPRLARMLGYESPEKMGTDVGSVAHQVYAERGARRRFRELIDKRGVVEDFETQWRRKDGSIFWVSLTGRLIDKETGGLIHHLGMARDISEQRKRDEEMRRFRAAMDISGDAILLVDRASMRYVDVNQTFCDLVGYTRQELVGMTPMELFSADRKTLERDYDAIIENKNSGANKVEGQYRRKDGALIPIETRRRALQTENGWIIVGTARDITERKEAEAKINRLNRVHAMLSGINAAIVRIADRAELFEEVCRISSEAGQFSAVWIGVVDRDAMLVKPVAWRGSEANVERLREAQFSLRENVPEEHSIVADAVRTRKAVVSNDVQNDPRIHQKEGLAALDVRSVAMLPLLAGNEVAGVLVLRSSETGFFDADEVKLLLELAGDIGFALDHIEKANRLDYLAYYDSLTGLANRTLFLERLSQCFHAAGLAGDKVALVLADVERFRTVNESLGRQAGDDLLKQLAGRLALGGGRGEVARIGADNFAVMLQGIKGKSEVTRRVERMWHECFSEAFRLGETDIRISAKAGVALFPNDGADAETLLGNAEAALRRAKETGERHLFHALEMTAKTGEKLTLENSLRQALEKDEFVLHYQPKVDLTARRIVGVEALIRWQNPELGLVPPGHFIPLMEETGLILDVGAWALAQAVSDHSRWTAMGLAAPRVAVNVSAIQLRRGDFVSVVKEALKRGSVPPGIDLEITESLVMEDIQGNIEKLKAIQALGLSIAIDDFGTGYSSLGYLAKLPLQALKIDRSFIITMLNNSDTMTLVQTIISLAHSLRLKVVAEGVEEEGQAKMLRLLRCDEMQGYLFSRPLPFDQLAALLAENPQG